MSLWSNGLAAFITLASHKLRLDPTMTSGPLVATMVDTSGLLLYFVIAQVPVYCWTLPGSTDQSRSTCVRTCARAIVRHRVVLCCTAVMQWAAAARALHAAALPLFPPARAVGSCRYRFTITLHTPLAAPALQTVLNEHLYASAVETVRSLTS